MKTIKFGQPDIRLTDLEKVNEIFQSGWLTHGKYGKLFEESFSIQADSKYALTVANCTAGLHLSCLYSGFTKGDQVLVPSQTHVATAHAVELTGATPIFIDVDPLTGNIDSEAIEEKINDKVKGIIIVHMAGYPCNMDKIMEIVRKHNLLLIEDCAHAIGTKYNGTHVGNFGLFGNFSFYPTKQVTTGEGGITITNDEEAYLALNKMRAFGIDSSPEARKVPGKYDVVSLGTNYRMTEFQAAIGYFQMERYQESLKLRKRNAALYCEYLNKHEYYKYPEYTDDNSYFIFQILLNDKIDRDKVVIDLKDRNIGISIHYATPLPLFSYYKNKYNLKSTDFANAVHYGNKVISLPVHPKLTTEDIKYISDNFHQIIDDNL